MEAILAAIVATITKAVEIGTAVAPLIPGITALFNNFASANGATQADFDRFHAIIKPYEDDLQRQADAAQRELNQG